MSNLVAIVGRPNVGKSTLFNRLTQTRQAIVDDVAGTTRDRQYGKCEWGNRVFSVVDTGGWVVNSDDVFEEEIRKQVNIAIEEADLILFLVDIKNGVTDLDDEVAGIRQTGYPAIFFRAEIPIRHGIIVMKSLGDCTSNIIGIFRRIVIVIASPIDA